MTSTENTAEPEIGTLPGQALTITMVDGTKHDLRILNPDLIRYDLVRGRDPQFPSYAEAKFLALTYFAFAAAKRTGLYDGTWTDFRDRDCVDVSDTTPADGSADARPTSPAPEAG